MLLLLPEGQIVQKSANVHPPHLHHQDQIRIALLENHQLFARSLGVEAKVGVRYHLNDHHQLAKQDHPLLEEVDHHLVVDQNLCRQEEDQSLTPLDDVQGHPDVGHPVVGHLLEGRHQGDQEGLLLLDVDPDRKTEDLVLVQSPHVEGEVLPEVDALLREEGLHPEDVHLYAGVGQDLTLQDVGVNQGQGRIVYKHSDILLLYVKCQMFNQRLIILPFHSVICICAYF